MSLNPKDTIQENIPSYILEEYPTFVAFLEGYYEWLSQEGNPYERIKNHMDYLSFDNSLDAYVDFMKSEYLSKIPQELLGDKKLFIEWSRKMNLSRGSHDSYKFLFKMLYGEQTTEIYLPKENILKTSDGQWVSGQSNMLITNSGNPEDFLYRKIYQKREVYAGTYVYAEAVVDSYSIRYVNGFDVLELVLTDIKGEFLDTHVIYTDEGHEEWPINTISEFEIIDGGQNYFQNERLELSNFNSTYTQNLYGEEGYVDTRISTRLYKGEIEVSVNGTTLTPDEFSYDGRFIYNDTIQFNDDVVFTIHNAYGGAILISDVDPVTGAVVTLKIASQPIAVNQDYNLNVTTAFGSGMNIVAKKGLVKTIPGRYLDQKGQLSANMFLQDGDYYQDYSYVIKTEQDITKYAEIVKEVLHPAGFKFFGNIRAMNDVQSSIDPVFYDIELIIQQFIFLTLAKYTLGNNYSSIGKNNGFMSSRVYSGDEWDSLYVTGETGYKLEDESREQTLNPDGTRVEVDKIGWMTKNNLEDFDIRLPQDFFEHGTYNGLWMEPNYNITNNMDEQWFIDKYINIYMTYDYSDEGYAD